MKKLRDKLKKYLIEFDTEHFITEIFVAVPLWMIIVLLTGLIKLNDLVKYLYNKLID